MSMTIITTSVSWDIRPYRCFFTGRSLSNLTFQYENCLMNCMVWGIPTLGSSIWYIYTYMCVASPTPPSIHVCLFNVQWMTNPLYISLHIYMHYFCIVGLSSHNQYINIESGWWKKNIIIPYYPMLTIAIPIDCYTHHDSEFPGLRRPYACNTYMHTYTYGYVNVIHVEYI